MLCFIDVLKVESCVNFIFMILIKENNISVMEYEFGWVCDKIILRIDYVLNKLMLNNVVYCLY